MVKKHFDRSDGKLDELTEEMRAAKQRLAGLEHEAQPLRHAMGEVVKSNTKTRKRMEDVAEDRAISGDSFSVNQVDPDQMCLTRFVDDSIIPLDLPFSRDDALVDKDAAAPKPCLSTTEMRTLTLAGDLPPASTVSKATISSFTSRLFGST